MLIRCERCSTLYELDEGLLSAEGSQVQCTRCEHVFTAHPSPPPGQTLVGVPAAAAPQPGAPEAPAAPAAREAVRSARPGAAGRAPPPSTRAPAPPARPASEAPRAPVRTGQPAVYRPSPGSSPVHRAPVLKRDTVGAFEARLRWAARARWIVPGAAAAALVLAGAAWFLLARRGDPTADRAREDGLALLARDDAGNLEAAEALLGEAGRRDPRAYAATAESALARALLAAASADEGVPIASRLAVKVAERDRLAREGPSGNEDAARAAAEVRALEAQLEPIHRRARQISAEAFARLQKVAAAHPHDPAVQRSLAVYFALAGDREQSSRAAVAAREKLRDDPWLAYAGAALDVRDGAGPARERGLVALGTVVAAHPDLIRARWTLALGQAEAGRRDDALSTLDGLLTANPAHERARRLRADLLAPPPPAPEPAAPVARPPAAAAAKPAPVMRKAVAQPPAPVPAEVPPVAPAVPAVMQPIPVAPPPGAPSAGPSPSGAAPAAGSAPPSAGGTAPAAPGGPRAPAAGGAPQAIPPRPPAPQRPAPVGAETELNAGG